MVMPKETPIDPLFDSEAQVAENLKSLREDVDFLLSLAQPRGLVEIEDKVLGTAAPSFDFQSISQDFRHLLIRISVRTDRVSEVDSVLMYFNNDTGAKYHSARAQLFHSAQFTTQERLSFTAMEVLEVAGDTLSLADEYAVGSIHIPDYTGSKNKHSFASGGFTKSATTTDTINTFGNGTWVDVAAINRITLVPGVGSNWKAGSRATLYGLG